MFDVLDLMAGKLPVDITLLETPAMNTYRLVFDLDKCEIRSTKPAVLCYHFDLQVSP